ncbi:MAG: DUF3999 domain-containing protein [Synergistaceae bacterium]|jgi:hypothetical protein|nr:DUF3999 domain-containing protein [Synergistaceae bacterium]
MKLVKRMKKITCFFGFAALFSFGFLSAFASESSEPPRPGLFDARYTLDAPESGGLYWLRLSDEVFKNVRYSYEWDVAVFNASGDLVPFMTTDEDGFNPLSGGEKTGGAAMEFPVPVYRMSGARSGPNQPEFSVKTDGEGRITEVTTGPAVESDKRGPGRYLLDLSGIAPRSNYSEGRALEITLRNAGDSTPIVSLYESEDLMNWTRLASGMPLIPERGEFPGRSRFVDVQGSPKYMTIEFESDDGVELESVAAHVREREVIVQAALESAEFDGEAIPDSNSFLYDTRGAFPADEANFTLFAPGIYSAAVYSRATSGDEWAFRGDITLSFIRPVENSEQSGEIKNQGIKIYGGSRYRDSRYWLLTLREKLSSAPRMALYWRPRALIFMAQGEGPYTLAVGNEKATQGRTPLQRPDLLTRILGPGRLAPSESRIVSRLPDNLPTVSEDKTNRWIGENWPQYAVWAVLVAGALTLSGMAWKLIRAKDTK